MLTCSLLVKGGGGVFLSASSVGIFTKCTFLSNTARVYSGGAVRVVDSASGIFHSCVFESNQAGYMGGAAYIYGSSASVFVMSTFAHNYANDYSRGGGAVALEGASTARFKQSVIDCACCLGNTVF